MVNSLRGYIAIIVILISALSLTLSGVWVYALYQKAFRDNVHVIESYQTIRAINRILLSVNEAALDVSAFIITGDKTFTKNLPQTIISIQLNLATLTQLIQDNPTEIEINKKISVLVARKIGFLQSTMKTTGIGNEKSLISNPDRVALTNNINILMDKIRDIEIGQLEKAMPEYELSMDNANRAFILLGILNLLLILLSYVIARSILIYRASV